MQNFFESAGKGVPLTGTGTEHHPLSAGLIRYKSLKIQMVICVYMTHAISTNDNVSCPQWVLRVTVHGRRREMGLGSAAEVSLKEGRTEAIRWWAVARNNVDPIKERERLRREAARHLHLLKEIAEDAFESRKAKLKGDVTAGRWFTPLKLHVIPQLGKMPIAEVDQIDIRDALSPIWPTKAETAKKALNRLHICFKHAAALGLDVDIHAPAKARALLGQQRHKATNIPAMPWRDVPSFYATLDDGTVTHLAFRLLILTGVRSSPLRFLRPDEQIQDDVWTKQQSA